MMLLELEHVSYLANVVFLAHADSAVSPRETAAIEEVRVSIGAKKGSLNSAIRAVESGQYSAATLSSFAANVGNLADMLYVCFVDGELAEQEKPIVLEFCRRAGITNEQLALMAREAMARVDQSKLAVTCTSCASELDSDSKFCPKCGSPLGSAEMVATSVNLQIPAQGYAVEFCESTAASFPAALEFAKGAATFSVCVKGKKTWHLATWPESAFLEVTQLAQLLSGIRNRKVYQNAVDVPWDEMFGFVWCASNRDAAYRPVEYCFGKDENRINPWGCKQAKMDWTEWAEWFSYGRFKGSVSRTGKNTWEFDKDRIRHELMTALHRVRYCPYLRVQLIDAVLRALPDQVEVAGTGDWKYSQAYQQVPGSIEIVEIEKSDGYQFKREYFADGVRPNGIPALATVLRKAFAEAGVGDIAPSQLTG